MTIEERVRKGAELLNKLEPDWLIRIDSAHLDISDSRSCVLGQLFGHFSEGAGILGCSHKELVSHGFASTSRGGGASYKAYEEYNKLTDAWMDYIEKERQA